MGIIAKVGKIAVPLIIVAGLATTTIVFSPLIFGVNDAGFTTVVQYPTGTMKVHTGPGWYMQWFGKVTEYPKQMTMDADADKAASNSTIDQLGVKVRYRDGGEGTIFGKMRFSLPEVEQDMLKLHSAFRSPAGVAHKLLKSVTEEAINQTAGLMSSEEGYDAKRATFTQWSKSQISGGLFKTMEQTVSVTDIITGKTVSKQVATPLLDDKKQFMHYPSDLAAYGVTLEGFQLNNPDFEPKTLKQIADKREATMAIITSKALAEKAKQTAITTEAQGKANVMKARYEASVIKESAIVEAERKKEVAIIQAELKVDVAKQERLQAEQRKLTASEYKAEQILIGQGDAERKRLVLEADGALEQKLHTYEVTTIGIAEAFSKQKWTPEITMGGSDSGASGNQAMELMQILGAKAAKDLALDLSIKQ